MARSNIKVWSASDFFEKLVAENKLAVELEFRFRKITGLDGLEEALASMQNTKNFVFVQENAAGYTALDNSPHTRKVRTVFIAMRYKKDDMAAYRRCMDTIAEFQRQFCSRLILERTRVQENMQFIDPRINLQEVSQYLIPGTAICMFEISVDSYVDLSYDPSEWNTTLNS